MSNEQKDLIFKRNKDLLALINFSGGWMFQSQLQEFALKMGYTSITMFRNELIKLEKNGIIRKETWNKKHNIIKLRNYALVKLQPKDRDLGEKKSKPTSIKIPTNYPNLAFKVAKNEQMIFLLNRVVANKFFDFGQLRGLPFKASYDTLFLKPTESVEWLRNLNEQKRKYINQKFYTLAYQNTVQGLYNSIKGLKKNTNKLNNLKSEINPAIQYDMSYDLFKLLGTNMFIDSMIFKSGVVKVTASYITTNSSKVKNIVDRFNKLDIYLSQLFNSNVKVITDFRIVTINLNNRKDIEDALKDMRLYFQITALNDGVEKKYDLRLKYPSYPK